MKITAILLFLLIFHLHAEITHSQNTTISFNLNNVTIEEVINRIEKETTYKFVFTDKVVDTSKEINIHISDSNIKETLDQLATQTDIEYKIVENLIVLLKKQPGLSLQDNTLVVKGTVTDARGEPIIGANIIEKKTTNGVITDIDGNFTLSVTQNAILQISYIGYIAQEIPTDGRSMYSIILKEDTKNLDEVVVVGYGVQKKINLTGSVASVKFDEEMSNRPITNASQALSGKIPGLWVNQTSGKPGDDAAQLRVRGWGTLNNSNPLIIIDGVEGAFNQINPNDIESITVLKDAASAAIYGSKAANGVILVTTKMGELDQKTQISLTSYAGVQTIGRKYDLIDNSAEHMQMINRGLSNVGSTPLFSESLISNFQNGTDKYKYPNTNWNDEFYRNALIHEHNLSIKGGSQRASSFLSFNYLGQDGIIPNTKSNRYSIRANLEYKINNWLKVGGRLNYMRKVADEPYELWRVYNMLAGATPYTAPYTRDGRYGSVQAIDENGTLLSDNRNPFIDANNGKQRTTDDFTTINAFADISFTKELILKTTFSTSVNWRMFDKHNEPLFGYTDDGMETTTLNYNREGLEMSRKQETSIRNNLYATLNYNKTFAEQHSISTTAGAQLEDYNWKNVFARRTDPPQAGLTQVDAGTNGIKGEGTMKGLRMFSYFGRFNYSFADKYLFEANIRADASSRFAKDNRWGYFPGFSAGWRLNEEEFIKKLNIFSNLKLRASWGQLGNQNIDEGYWPYLTTIDQNYNLSYSYNGNLAPGAGVTALVDENITWETTTTLDLGIDVGLLDNRLNIEADYFYKTTKDIIVQLPIPMILGKIDAPYENIGEMVNKGIELSASYGNKAPNKDQFGYNIGVNFTYINNKVTKFRGGKSPDQLRLIREEFSYQTLYGYKAVGVYQTNEEAAEHMHANGYKPSAGDLKFEDRNGDGKLGFEDKQDIGNTIPKVTYGLTANFTYKNFDLNLLFQGIAGSYLYTFNEYTGFQYNLLTITKSWRDAWTPENRNTNTPRLVFDSTWNAAESSFWAHKSDFLKLKNIQFGYTIPQSFSNRLKLEKIYVYANAQNVFTLMMHKGYQGFDPERANSNGYDIYPSARVFSFGINVNF